MWRRFTANCRRAMHLAHAAVRNVGHVEIMPIDVLSGLLSQNECTARRAPGKLGVSADALRKELEQLSPWEEGLFNPLTTLFRPLRYTVGLIL